MVNVEQLIEVILPLSSMECSILETSVQLVHTLQIVQILMDEVDDGRVKVRMDEQMIAVLQRILFPQCVELLQTHHTIAEIFQVETLPCVVVEQTQTLR